MSTLEQMLLHAHGGGLVHSSQVAQLQVVVLTLLLKSLHWL